MLRSKIAIGFLVGSLLLAGAAVAQESQPVLRILSGTIFFAEPPEESIPNEPEEFLIPDVNDQAPYELVQSAPIEIKGFQGSSTLSVSGDGAPEISTDGGSVWGTSAVANAGDFLMVRLTSGSFSRANVATVTLGETSATFTVRTRAQDIEPNFSIPPMTGVAVGSLVTSQPVTPIDFEGDVDVTVSDSATASVSTDGGITWGVTKTITAGGSFLVRQNASALYNTPISATVTVGTVSATFSVTTKVQDTLPNQVTFATLTSQSISTVVTSNSVSLAGFDGPLFASLAGGTSAQMSINGGAWVTSATVMPSQTMRIRFTTSAAYSTSATVTLTIGTGKATFTASTMVAPWPATSLAFLVGSTSSSSVISIPSPAQVGDLAILMDAGHQAAGTSGVAIVRPAGWQLLGQTANPTGSKVAVSYKVLTAADLTTGTAIGMSSGVSTQKVMHVYRPNGTISSLTAWNTNNLFTGGPSSASSGAAVSVAPSFTIFAVAGTPNLTLTTSGPGGVGAFTRNNLSAGNYSFIGASRADNAAFGLLNFNATSSGGNQWMTFATVKIN